MKRLPFLILLSVVVLATFGPLLKNLSGMIGVPNWIPLIRDPLLIWFAAYGISRSGVLDQASWRWFLLWLLIFMAAYMGVSIVQDRAVVGLYYLRIYLLPIFFCVGLIGFLAKRDGAVSSEILLRFLLKWNLIVFVIALAIYITLLEMPALRPKLFGSEILPTAWYISGGTLMRMGLPTASPNALGVIFSLHALGFLLFLLCAPNRSYGPSNSKLVFHMALALLGLALTFSRSSMLLFLIGAATVVFIPGVMTFDRLVKLCAFCVLGLLCLSAVGYGFDVYSDGYVERWIRLNLEGRDPSALGHARSVQEAIGRWDEYLMFGYLRGSVGPKAQLFTGNINNVESSWLGLIFDMGIFNFVPYALCLVALLANGYFHSAQWAVLLGLVGPFLMLPQVFEADVVVYCFLMYVAFGFVLKRFKEESVCGVA